MSNITAALPCCCGQPEPGDCCTQFPLPFPPFMSISWTGNINVILPACACDPDVPNFECPCSGGMSISGGVIASGPRQIFAGGCGYDLTAYATPGQVAIFCPCDCEWEDPPGSGQFFRYCEDYPQGCGPFNSPAFASLHSFGANLVTGLWEVLVAFESILLSSWEQPNGSQPGTCSYTVCGHGAAFGTRSFNPLVGYDTLGPLRFIGPEIRFCPDGSVDIRSAFGPYNPENAFAVACPNTIIANFNPGMVMVS